MIIIHFLGIMCILVLVSILIMSLVDFIRRLVFADYTKKKTPVIGRSFDQLKILKDLEETYNNHNPKTCRVDCCILCYSERNEKRASSITGSAAESKSACLGSSPGVPAI